MDTFLLGKLVAQYRKQKGMTRRELAYRLDLSESGLKAYEAGVRTQYHLIFNRLFILEGQDRQTIVSALLPTVSPDTPLPEVLAEIGGWEAIEAKRRAYRQSVALRLRNR